jgi:hypothetical protein
MELALLLGRVPDPRRMEVGNLGNHRTLRVKIYWQHALREQSKWRQPPERTRISAAHITFPREAISAAASTLNCAEGQDAGSVG